tara:strand:+ start:2336 stop:3379 length:1044 start_codon:yes stop_codon:yes gene_type:complete
MPALVYAPSIFSGGGLTLLVDFIEEVKIKQLDIQFLVNEELREIVPDKLLFDTTKPGLINRLRSELKLRRESKNFSKLLMFCNLPPWFNLSCEVITFVQNRLILEMHRSHYRYPKAFLRIKLLSILFFFLKNNSHKWVVQTNAMKALLMKHKQLDKNIKVFRTIPSSLHNSLKVSDINKGVRNFHKFLSVTNPEPHKNNDTLINAWISLSKEGHFPELNLVTITLNKKLDRLIRQAITKYSLNINVFENIPNKDIKNFYEEADCLIFTSGCESLGLPLIEARAADLPILASDQDFVFEISKPMMTFDPENYQSVRDSVLAAINGRLNYEKYRVRENEFSPISMMFDC